MERIIRLRELVRQLCRSESSIRRDVAAGRFPKPVRIGPRAIGWRESDIQAYIAGLQTSEASNA